MSAQICLFCKRIFKDFLPFSVNRKSSSFLRVIDSPIAINTDHRLENACMCLLPSFRLDLLHDYRLCFEAFRGDKCSYESH